LACTYDTFFVKTELITFLSLISIRVKLLMKMNLTTIKQVLL